jgi:hypothetical protein
MNTNPDWLHPITEQNWDKDDAPTEGITEAYAWYQAKVLADEIDAVKFNLQRVITVLEERRRDNLRVIGELLRENTALKAKLKEKNNG